MSIQRINDATESLLYSLNGLSKETPSEFDDLGTNILYGSALTPLLAFPYKKTAGGIKAFYNGGKGNKVSAWKLYYDNLKAEKAHLKDNSSRWQTMKNRENFNQMQKFSNELIPKESNKSFSEITKSSQIKKAKYEYKIKRKSYYNEVERLINDAKAQKLTGKALNTRLSEIKDAYAKAQLAEHNAIVNGELKAVTRRGKIGRYVKTKSGYYKVKGKYLQVAAKTSKTGSFLRAVGRTTKIAGKGNALFAVISGVFEIPDIISAYNCDKQEKENGNYMSNRGTKQLAKSGTKVATGVLGYAAGAAAAGAIAGSVIPGLGNIAGAIIGFAGGCIGGAIASWSAGKMWDACEGKDGSYNKSEADLYAEEKVQEYKEKIVKSPKLRDEFLADAAEVLLDEDGNFLGDEEQLKAFEVLVQDHKKRYNL